MLKRYLLKQPLARLALPLVSTSVVGWAVPAHAAPQLLFEQVEASGDVEACTLRAYSALDDVGMEGIALTSPTVSSSNGEVTATVFCESLDAGTFEAIVMVAGQDESVTANMGYIMGAVSAELRSDAIASSADPVPMNDEAFSQFLTALDDSWPQYLDFLAQPVANNYFTAAQASQIVEAVRFGNEEVQTAVMLYPRVVDKNNWYLVEQSVTFEFDRQQLRQQIAALD